MENHIRPPQPLSNNSSKAWFIWKEEFLIFMRLLGYMERTDYYKANIFKNLVGSVGIEIISKLSFDRPEDKEILDILLKKIDEYHNPPQTETEKRYQFFNCNMNPNETIENYIQRLREKANNCEFGNLKDSLIIDVIILHANDKVLRKKYLKENNLNCEKIIEIYKNHRILTLESTSTNPNTNPATKPKQKPKGNVANPKEQENPNLQQKKSCWRCRTVHEYKQCPAWNNKCKTCGEMRHFEGYCQNLLNQTKNVDKKMNNLAVNKSKGQSVNEKKVFNNFPNPM